MRTGAVRQREPDGQELDRRRVPVPGPPPVLRLPAARRFALDNGLPVVLVEKHELPVVAVELLMPGGATDVPAPRAGLASLTADMIDEGAGGRDALRISAELERLGATLNTSAGYDASHAELIALRPRLEAALDLLADVLLRPAFAEDDLVRVRRTRMDRVLQLEEEPRSLANDALARVLYGDDHPWGPPLLGTRGSLAALGRDHVDAFHAAHYHAGNATVIAAGDVTEAELRALLQPRLGEWERRPAPSASLAEAPALERAAVHVVDRPGAAQSEIRVGRVAVAHDSEDYFTLVVLNTILGGAFTSRLNLRLREEKGFTYGAHSGFHTRHRPGPFVAQAAVHTPATAEAVMVFLEEIEKLREEPVPVAELARARSYAALRLPQRFETVEDLVARYAEVVLHDLPDDYWSGYVSRLMEVDAEAVLAAARRHLDPRRMAVVVVGDRAAVETPLRALGMPVHVRPAEVR